MLTHILRLSVKQGVFSVPIRVSLFSEVLVLQTVSQLYLELLRKSHKLCFVQFQVNRLHLILNFAQLHLRL